MRAATGTVRGGLRPPRSPRAAAAPAARSLPCGERPPHRGWRSRLLLSLLVLLFVPSMAFAQSASVTVEPKLAATSAAPGDAVDLTIHVVVGDGWHLYPPGASEGVPVSVKLDAVPGVTMGPLVAKSGQKTLKVEGIGDVQVLEGSFDLACKLQVGKDAALGARKITGSVNYQACNDQSCEMPKDAPFELALDVAPPSVAIGPPVELPKTGPVIATLSGGGQVAAGAKGTVTLELFVRKGFHVYGPGTEGGRETKLELELPAGFTAGELDAPPPTRVETDDLGKANLWEGKVKLARSFTAPANAKGPATIKARAKWLVCDEKGCRPGKEEKELALDILPASGAAPSSATAITTPPTTPPPSSESGGSGIGALILTAISLGFVNVLMPCTLPMIPITISIFSKGKKLSRGESVSRASIYAAGIIISFALVGGLVQAIFGNSGQGFVRTIAINGPLNLAIGALFVYFGLSFFGYYEITVPEFLRAFVEKSVDKAKQAGPAGEKGVPIPALFLMGFFFVVTSYTCGAPLILGVLTAGLATPAKGSVLLATAVFGATTALPFFVLALVPGFLKSLPRSGGWFKTFKIVLGIVEIAAALKFFSNADIYWHDGHAGLLTRNVFLATWVAAGLLITIFVAHVIKFAHDEDATEPAPRFQARAWLRAMPFLALTLYVARHLDGPKVPVDGPGFQHLWHEIDGNFEGFLPPESRKGKAGSPVTEYASYEKALAAARASGKPLFLEFTGHT